MDVWFNVSVWAFVCVPKAKRTEAAGEWTGPGDRQQRNLAVNRIRAGDVHRPEGHVKRVQATVLDDSGQLMMLHTNICKLC